MESYDFRSYIFSLLYFSAKISTKYCHFSPEEITKIANKTSSASVIKIILSLFPGIWISYRSYPEFIWHTCQSFSEWNWVASIILSVSWTRKLGSNFGWTQEKNVKQDEGKNKRYFIITTCGNEEENVKRGRFWKTQP